MSKLNKSELLFLEIMGEKGYKYNEDNDLKGIKVIDFDNTIDVITVQRMKRNRELKKHVSYFNTSNDYSSVKKKIHSNLNRLGAKTNREKHSLNSSIEVYFENGSVRMHYRKSLVANSNTITPKRQSIKVRVGNC